MDYISSAFSQNAEIRFLFLQSSDTRYCLNMRNGTGLFENSRRTPCTDLSLPRSLARSSWAAFLPEQWSSATCLKPACPADLLLALLQVINPTKEKLRKCGIVSPFHGGRRRRPPHSSSGPPGLTSRRPSRPAPPPWPTDLLCSLPRSFTMADEFDAIYEDNSDSPNNRWGNIST